MNKYFARLEKTELLDKFHVTEAITEKFVVKFIGEEPTPKVNVLDVPTAIVKAADKDGYRRLRVDNSPKPEAEGEGTHKGLHNPHAIEGKDPLHYVFGDIEP